MSKSMANPFLGTRKSLLPILWNIIQKQTVTEVVFSLKLFKIDVNSLRNAVVATNTQGYFYKIIRILNILLKQMHYQVQLES